VGWGSAKEALNKLCEKYFGDWEMSEMHLEVAIFNLPGIRCYERCGFKRTEKFWNPRAYQRFLDFDHDPRLIPIRQYFRRNDHGVEVEYLKMQLIRSDYLKLQSGV